MRVLVVGANGLLDSNVVHVGLQRELTICGSYHSTQPAFEIPLTQFDLRDHTLFEDVLTTYDPDVVINCAAMTDMDDCERDLEQAQLLNGDVPGKLAAHCAATGVPFVHVSTDYVFDGTNREPYIESAATNPRQVYVKSKLSDEQAVTDVLPDALVARFSFV
ncbi:SDR family oxidoreductase [Halorubrum sp. HHNYT27]|uniref:SDR family oxidoreductase n=1 Tax=Halorubrum sp. HHNYT27 TaxID=3402275 RepID=UPI003EBE65D5